MNDLIPVTVLTGFLGAGKTTLLNRMLSERHGRRIAVIENEFGEAGIDNDLLVHSTEQVAAMNNGCLCCTVRGDLLRILGELGDRRTRGELHFDHVVIETTGLADPAPVAQTFFVEPEINAAYRLDAVITVVDAKHAMDQLDGHHEAREQVGFADRILVSKRDLVGTTEYEALLRRLRAMNGRARILPIHAGTMDLAGLLDVRGFNLNDILEIEPDFLSGTDHEHDDAVRSFVIRERRPYDADRLLATLETLAMMFGKDMMRYKGLLHVAGNPSKIAFQGVHMIVGGQELRPWREDEVRESVMVFIGRDLPEARFRQAFDISVAS